jgi:hypothetical protein
MANRLNCYFVTGMTKPIDNRIFLIDKPWRTSTNMVRCAFLELCSREIYRMMVPGEFAEVGVGEGGPPRSSTTISPTASSCCSTRSPASIVATSLAMTISGSVAHHTCSRPCQPSMSWRYCPDLIMPSFTPVGFPSRPPALRIGDSPSCTSMLAFTSQLMRRSGGFSAVSTTVAICWSLIMSTAPLLG